MARTPEFLTLKQHRDHAERRYVPWRRGAMLVVGAIVVAGLANAFGQRPGTARAEAKAASLSVYAPSRVRGGLYYEARFHIVAHKEIKNAILLLNNGWAEGMTINTIEPSPLGEASRNGSLALQLGHIPAGKSFILYMQLQVNPTNVGARNQGVELDDGPKKITSIDRSLFVFP